MRMPAGGNLVVPVVLWGRNVPAHTISALCLSANHKTIITGSTEGQICLWEFNPHTQHMMPKLMLYGHSGAITCIVEASLDKPHFVSSSDLGELCLWDTDDGRCIESSKSTRVHRRMQGYKFEANRSLSLICNGNYPEIHILDPSRLEVIYSLVAQVHPDWINALCILKPVKREDDVILAITNSGTIKMWSINIHTVKSAHIYEDESKQIRCVEAQSLHCCPYHQRTVLVVCSKYWQIYDAGEFSLLCNEPCSEGNRWVGGRFLAIDKVIVWNSTGQAFIYKLPHNANYEHGEFHHQVGPAAVKLAVPTLICLIDSQQNKVQPIPSLFVCDRHQDGHLLVRADADGTTSYWKMHSKDLQSQSELRILYPRNSMSIEALWRASSPVGLLDNVQAYTGDDKSVVTCSLFIEQSARLLCGMSNGDIIIIPLIHTVKSLLLTSKRDSKGKFPYYRLLSGHTARVNCLVYPYSYESRYSPNFLLSGSSDFTVNLWDLSLSQLIHTFRQHAGEIIQFYIPPPNCNPRILSCICSVANDHSVALLSLKERRTLVFASRHMFPVECIKWRPVEDYMVISCTDSTAYIWQMETGLLDRVVHGVTALEILKACDETSNSIQLNSNPTNPQLTIGQALKRRNLATFRSLAQQTIQQIENMVDEDITTESQESSSTHTQPLMVQGLKTTKDQPDAHILLFDTEALIVQLLCEEFGIPSTEYHCNQAGSGTESKGEMEQKITDFLSMVKEKAEVLSQTALQSKAENLGMQMASSSSDGRRRGSSESSGSRDSERTDKLDSFSMEIAQVMISLLHSWSLAKDLDRLCIKKIGLERLEMPVSYGLISPNGRMVLMLPTCRNQESNGHPAADPAVDSVVDPTADLAVDPADSVVSETDSFLEYWEISSALTTQHLLSVISVANTMMSMEDASFVKQSNAAHRKSNGSASDQVDQQTRRSLIKQGWSLIASQHCVLLPDLVNSQAYKSPQLHLLANRWQDRCLEVREASQALLLAELRRIGAEGRQRIIEQWAPHMPNLTDDQNGSISMAEPEDILETLEDAESGVPRVTNEKRRMEATAIVMLAVIGSEFGSEIEPSSRRRPVKEDKARGSLFGFGLQSHSLALHTSKALAYLLLNPVDCKLPLFAPIRRAAIDLLGRGFTVWQPYIDVSAVLLGLLEICIDADRIIPSVPSGLPLSAAADACRTARHALTLIATARPATFLTCMAKEVARYNAAAQNPQSGTQLNTSVLIKAKSEILRVIELLIEKMPNDVSDLLIETMDVAVHCLDPNSIKARGLQETFPALCRFPMVSYCASSRRICVGSKNGTMAFYELKQSKAQSIPFQTSPTSAMIFYLKASSKETISAHKGAVAAVCFSEDGKYLASYSPVDSKVFFWQTASASLFGIGGQHTKCIKSYSVPFRNPGPPGPNVTRGGRLHWADHRTISLLLPDGTESKYKV